MIVEAKVTINGSRAAVWDAIADIANASEIVSSITRIKILHKPEEGLIGLRWRETRILFGEPATVEKWITDAVERKFYKTRAEDKGFVFLTTVRISERDGGGAIKVISSHESRPQTFMAKLQAIMLGLMFRGVIRRAILQDLNDIKTAVERQ